MKNEIIIFAYIIGIQLCCAKEPSDEFRRIEAAQVALWTSKLAEAQHQPPANRPAKLRLGLTNMGHRKSFGSRSPAVDEIYRKIQEELLSVPGHARYFADELERLRLDPKSDYWRMRQWYLAETLKHLPSPETIQVLGHYLDDERDLPRDRIPGYKEFVESLEKPPEFQIFPPENARLAVYALSRIGLRDAPCPVIRSYGNSNSSDWEGTLPKCREWYAKVKSGELAFSFIGQNVEYRFKPDGTWETTEIDVVDPPPAEQPEQSAIPSVESPARQDTLDAIESEATSSSPLWPWLAAGCILLIAAAIWRFKAGSKR